MVTADDDRRGALRGAAIAALAVVLWFVPLLAGRTLALRDVLCDFLPWREFAAATLARGELPLWAHASRFGQPFLAHPQSGVFYPPHLLWLVLPSPAALTATLLLHSLLAALGAYALALRLDLGRLPALVAAAGLTFSTYLVAQMEFLPAFETVTWAPLLAWALLRSTDALRTTGRVLGRETALLALLLGTAALAGHPQALLQSVAFAVVGSGTLAVAGHGARALGRVLVAVVVAGALGACLAAPQILVSLDHVAGSTRDAAFDAGLAEASVGARSYLALLAPFAFGRPGYGAAWWHPDVYEFWAATCHVGIVPLLLVPFAWAAPRGSAARRVALAFTAVAMLGALLAAGRHTPLYPFLAAHVPPFDRLRWPGKFLHLVAFALPFAGAAGLRALLDGVPSRAARALLALPIALLVVVAAARLAAGSATYAALLGSSVDAPDRLAFVAGEHARLVVVLVLACAALAVLVVERGRRARAAAAASVALVALAFVDAATQAARVHPLVSNDVLRARPAWLDDVRAAGPGRLHSTHSLAQEFLYGVGDPAWLQWARDASLGESALPFGVARTWGFGQLVPRRAWAAWERLQDPRQDATARARVSDALSVRTIVHGEPFSEERLAGRPPHVRVLVRETCPAPVRVATRIVPVADASAALDAIGAPGFDAARDVALEGAPPALPAGSGPGGELLDVRETTNGVRVRVRADRAAALVVADGYDPRWRATIDGAEAAVLPANAVDRAVLLAPGEHDVVFTYREPRLLPGLALACVALAALAFAWRRARSAGGVTPPAA